MYHQRWLLLLETQDQHLQIRFSLLRETKFYRILTDFYKLHVEFETTRYGSLATCYSAVPSQVLYKYWRCKYIYRNHISSYRLYSMKPRIDSKQRLWILYLNLEFLKLLFLDEGFKSPSCMESVLDTFMNLIHLIN